MRLGVEAALVDGSLVAGDVEVAGGRIAGFGLASPNGRGIAVPGFVDLQVNGFAGVDFLTADADGYRSAGEALLETGVTAFLPTFITSPEEQLLAALREVPARRRDSRTGPASWARTSKGLSCRPCAWESIQPLLAATPTWSLLERLLDAGPVRLVTLAPELPGASEVIERLVQPRDRRLAPATPTRRPSRRTRPSTSACAASRTCSTRCARSITATRASRERRWRDPT